MRKSKTTIKKEQIYENEIRPLMAQIINICKANNISFACQFMTEKKAGYISTLGKRECKPHIDQVKIAMLFDELKTDKAGGERHEL